jgi:hypothetical protein
LTAVESKRIGVVIHDRGDATLCVDSCNSVIGEDDELATSVTCDASLCRPFSGAVDGVTESYDKNDTICFIDIVAGCNATEGRLHRIVVCKTNLPGDLELVRIDVRGEVVSPVTVAPPAIIRTLSQATNRVIHLILETRDESSLEIDGVDIPPDIPLTLLATERISVGRSMIRFELSNTKGASVSGSVIIRISGHGAIHVPVAFVD